MVRTKTDGDRVEVTSAPGLAARVLAVLYLALGVFGLGWLVTSVGRSELRHFTCDRSSGSCALQSGDDVSLIKLSSIKAVTVVEHPVHYVLQDGSLVVVLEDGSARTIGRDALNPTTQADYQRAAGEIRAFLAGIAPTIKAGYTWRASWIDSWPAILLSGGGLLMGLWRLLHWKRRHTIIDKGTSHVTWASTGPLRRTRQRKVPFAEVKGVGRGRRRLDVVLAGGKKLRVAEGDTLEEAEKALAAALPKPAPPPPPPVAVEKDQKRKTK